MDFVSKKIDFVKAERPYLIGEIGVNHNKNYETLFKLIDVAINAKVDIVKLQRFNSSLEISKFSKTANYQKKNTGHKTQLELAKSLELPDEWIFKAYDYCKKKNIGFLCAGFDSESVDFISRKLRCKTIKSPSSEINNKFLISEMSKKFKSLIISSGASTMNECLKVKKWVLDNNKKCEMLFMHCVSEYPSPEVDSNLNAIINMRKKLNLPIGLSDHTDGIFVPILSLNNQCLLIEKHFTLSKKMKGPDHKASIEPKELKELSFIIRNYKNIMGTGIKKPTKSEIKNRNLIRKSAVCSKRILKKGAKIKFEDMNFKRPYILGAATPENFKKIIGKKLIKDLKFDKPFLIRNIK